MNEWNGIYCRYKMRAQRLWSGVSAMWTAISTIVYVWCVCVVHIYLARANGAPSVWASFGPPKWRVCWSLWIAFFFSFQKQRIWTMSLEFMRIVDLFVGATVMYSQYIVGCCMPCWLKTHRRRSFAWIRLRNWPYWLWSSLAHLNALISC